MNRALAVHHLETVVIGGVVASRDHHSGIGVQMENGIVEQRSGDDPEIGHLAARSKNCWPRTAAQEDTGQRLSA